MASVFCRSRSSRRRQLRVAQGELERFLRAHGITGWRWGQKVFGNPDFVFRRERVAVFVDGCFWHRHPGCRFAYTPKSRLEFWLPKFAQNVARDRLVTRTLRRAGWRVVRVGECELAQENWPRVVGRIRRALAANVGDAEHSRLQVGTRSRARGSTGKVRPIISPSSA